MEDSWIQLANIRKIMRTSIYTFLQQYHHFTSSPTFLAFPFSASLLLAQQCPPLSTLQSRLQTLFHAAGFPPSSTQLSLSFSSSFLTIPFSLSFLILAKQSSISICNSSFNLPKETLPTLYGPVVRTSICSSLFMIAADAATFSFLFIAFSLFEELGLGFPSFGDENNNDKSLFRFGILLVYSIIHGNALVISNLAVVLTATGRGGGGGLMAIVDACVAVRGRSSMALMVAVPANLGMAAIQGLFRRRIVRPYYDSGREASGWMALEGMFIAYLHSIVVVFDTIVTFVFLQSCKEGLKGIKTIGDRNEEEDRSVKFKQGDFIFRDSFV